MISSGELTTSQMAEAAGCSKRAILRIRSNLRLLGTIKAPPIKAGRPRSITPVILVQVSKFHRDQRYQILPAYAQDSIVLSRVFRGSTNASVFEDFIEQLLQHCGKWPEPKSVIVMDNASFNHS
jgi:hypothetical protein